MVLSPVIQKRLEAQGFVCSDTPSFVRIEPWLRFTPAACTILIGLGTILALVPLLWATVAIAALGAVFPIHPFDLVYNLTLRYITGTDPLPKNRPPRRFACGMAAVWLVGTVLAFQAGAAWLGYVLGGLLTAMGLLVSVSHFCIPSVIYRALFVRGRG